jgi:hypothetical protein
VSVGLYELFSGTRLPATLDGTPAGDRIALGQIVVR